MSAFKGFLLKTNALALAVGVIIGVALGNVITSLVNDIIMPPLGYLLGNVDFSQMKIVLKAASSPTAADEVAIRYGAFVNVVISFVIIALIVYVIASLLIRPAPEPETKVCKYCKETVPADATKCRACTSTL